MLALCGATLVVLSGAVANVVQVGPSRTYTTLAAGYGAANEGDVIAVDAGDYPNTAVKIGKSNLTIKGVGGRPHLWFEGDIPNGKGVVVIEDPSVHDITFENLEISGGTGTSGNEAAIRFQGKNLTVRGCYLHDSFNGILEGHDMVSGSDVVVETSEFAHNGRSGYEHNMYISHSVASFTLRYSYSHHVLEGHLVKSRAKTNYIVANRITDETPEGSGNQASALIDIPEGGPTYIVGNLLHKGSRPGNPIAAIWYARENGSGGDFQLYVVNNTYVSDTGRASTALIVAQRATTVFVANNIVVGPSSLLVSFEDSIARSVTIVGNLLDTAVAAETTVSGATVMNPPKVASPKLVDLAGFDWRLGSDSPAIDSGVDPGSANGLALTPNRAYVHEVQGAVRTIDGAVDIGAYELNAVGAPAPSGESLPTLAPAIPSAPNPNAPSTPPVNTGAATSQPPSQSSSSPTLSAPNTSVSGGCSAIDMSSLSAIATMALALGYRTRRRSRR